MTTEEAWNGIKEWLLRKFLGRWDVHIPFIDNYVDLVILYNPTPQQIAAEFQHTFRISLVDDVYAMFKYVSELLYNTVSTVEDILNGPYIIRLPSDIAFTIIDPDDEIFDFRLPDRTFGFSNLLFVLPVGMVMRIVFILKVNENLEYKGINIPGTEHWSYWDPNTNTVKEGTEFTPTKYYTDRSITKDILFIGLVTLIVKALISAGKLLWAEHFASTAITTVNSIRSVGINTHLKTAVDNLAAWSTTHASELASAISILNNTTGLINELTAIANNIDNSDLETVKSKLDQAIAILQSVGKRFY